MLLSDGVITLRPIAVDDAPAHLAGEDAELVRWLNDGPGTPEGVRAYFEERVADWESDGATRTFAILEQEGGALVGTLDVEVEQPFLAKGQANLAYGIYPQWRGRGLATRAVILGCRFLAAAGMADEAVLRIDPSNAASVAVARRARFRYLRGTDEPGEGRLDWYIQAV
ncbi:GNAT family N-acetyltransferase [Nocardia puris]|uniref:RimJ/RimL family protein N-acetyltransferase n=1 Tax=Nocardia puris TaxID=208602 RepID=A0A366E3L4_9NOCA|nr:GNAT family N-acetyltransferase [Nocardia puris]MBF6209618.1 GNAT family N-acetyltransferase [Nocardia puris]MBF6366190.1 GNAT family N-acetyltransferase [Nocardia puris]MBF6458471.1 GNAT family N-acetyltransferase [Nocardia puris]RBO96114.1 RimJ/RimL family protein N-acetyltransferase [Nocardia puris]